MAAQARIPQAGALPDPQLQIGVSNLELPGLSATMPASMAPAIGLMQGFPFPGKRGLREEVAGFMAQSAALAVEEAEWRLRTDVSRAYFDLLKADRELEVQRSAEALLRDALLIAEALYASGGGGQTDVLRASVAVARIEGEVHRLEASRKIAAAQLNALLDYSPAWPTPTPTVPSLPVVEVPLDSLRLQALVDRPLLQAASRRVAAADASVELADRDIWPDIRVGVQYAQRPTDEGQKHMGGASVGVNLPVFAGSKQNRARDEAAAELLEARSLLADLTAMVEGDLARILADLERSRSLLELYQREILPQARATVESALSSYRSGSVDFLTLLDAEVALVRFEAEAVGLLSEYGTAVAELEATLARPFDSPQTLEWDQ
jgi:outer membrane protein TolC